MGGGPGSQKTPLGYLLKHFKDRFEEEGGYSIKKWSKGFLRTLCELEWPKFGVGWPDTGSFDPRLVRALWDVVTGEPGHPDQFPYFD